MLQKLFNIPKYNSASKMFVYLNIPSLINYLVSMCILSETVLQLFICSMMNMRIHPHYIVIYNTLFLFLICASYTHVFLSLLFNTFIIHGYLPADFMKNAIVTIIKNKTGDTSDKNNYRPIALVTAASKLFEICILEILETYLIPHDHQFGFKAKHATDMCIFTVKTLVKYYTDQMTPVYTCLLDASKAFYRVKHWTLFAKLIKTGAPLLIVRFLLFWYQNNKSASSGVIPVQLILLFEMVYGRVEFCPHDYFPYI